MIRTVVIVVVSLWIGAPARASDLEFTVRAGGFDRRDTPIRFDIPETRLGPAVRDALKAGPAAVAVHEVGTEERTPWIAQLDRADPGSIRVTWILAKPLAKGAEARYRIDLERPVGIASVWKFPRKDSEALELTHDDRPVFRYNAAPVASPKYKAIQERDSYLHPVFSPAGHLITGDFSSYHPHHRGIFLAYAHAEVAGEPLDFWNIHTDRGRIRSEGYEAVAIGPITARFVAKHRWEAKDHRPLIRERWEVEAYHVPGSGDWLFDLTSSQVAVDRPVEILPYRYGGMAYRGAEPFVQGQIDVLTSEGKHRVDGDQKPARWVDLTGPIENGSPTYAGAMVAEHPGNPRAPSVVRIHPTTLPFFSFVPAYREKLTIGREAPLTFRFRIRVHDGRPDGAIDERTWRDFADPPAVVVAPGG
jgi:hypothetical protein